MASRTEADPRKWTNFWSTTTTRDNCRYRQQVKLHRRLRIWTVRTEVWPDGDYRPYYTRTIEIPDDVGMSLFEMRKTWSNVDPEDGPMFPPGYESGFLNLKEKANAG